MWWTGKGKVEVDKKDAEPGEPRMEIPLRLGKYGIFYLRVVFRVSLISY